MHANNAEHPAIQKSLNPHYHRVIKVIVKDDFKKYIYIPHVVFYMLLKYQIAILVMEQMVMLLSHNKVIPKQPTSKLGFVLTGSAVTPVCEA